MCWRLFEYLPLACLVDERVLCLHGGLGKHVKDIDQIRRIKKPVNLKPGFVHEDPVVVDILWSDPVRSSSSRIPHARTWCSLCLYSVTTPKSQEYHSLIPQKNQCTLDDDKNSSINPQVQTRDEESALCSLLKMWRNFAYVTISI